MQKFAQNASCIKLPTYGFTLSHGTSYKCPADGLQLDSFPDYYDDSYWVIGILTSSKKRFAFNVVMNWLSTAVNMVVPFFLTPFVVRHLGAVQYGIWILSVSIVSYLALLDLGMRSAVIRFVSKAEGEGAPERGAHIISAALWIRLLIALAVAALSFGLSFAAPHLFKIPLDLMHAARVTVALCGFGVAITLVGGVFGAVLSAIQRFDLLSTVTMCQTVCRAAGVLWILHKGHGLIMLAWWELFVVLCAALLTCIVAVKVYPSARTKVRRPERSLLSSLWSYSFTTFILMIAVQIVINTDALVIGAFLSVGLVTFYTLGSSLVSYTATVASSVSTTFTPMASKLDASGQSGALTRMLLRGTQAMLGLVLPISAALLFRGETFITLWMGPTYGHISERVLQILMISLFFSMANATAGAIMMAVDKHKPVAIVAVAEALLNLGVSIVLARRLGLYGVAWGTSATMMLTHLFFWPRYVRKELGVPIGLYLWQGWGRILLSTFPFAIVCAVADHFWHPASLLVFFAQVLVTLPVYAVTLALTFREETRAVLTALAARWKPDAGPASTV